MLLALARDLGRYFETTSAGGWVRPPTTELRDKTIGVIGLGRIGRSVVRRLQGFEVDVVAAEPFPDSAFVAEHGVDLVDIDEVFRRADFVTLHTPMTDETRQVANERTLELMRPGSFLVNTARGGLVDEAALRDALDSGHLAGAALDVRTSEPPPDGDDRGRAPERLGDAAYGGCVERVGGAHGHHRRQECGGRAGRRLGSRDGGQRGLSSVTVTGERNAHHHERSDRETAVMPARRRAFVFDMDGVMYRAAS